MALSEVIVRRGDRGPAVQSPDDVSTRFEAVITERGPVGVPIVAVSKRQMHDLVGDNQPYTTLRACDAYFDEGGTRVVLSRVVGPAARAATLALRDGSSGTVLTWTAEGPGAWYHGLTISVAPATGTDQTITVKLNGTVLASGVATDAASAKAIIDSAGYGTAAIGAGTWSTIAALTDRPLAGGDDDRANIRDADVIRALTAFSDALGPGSVCASAWTSATVHTALAQHARVDSQGTGYNRFARCDLPDLADAATLISQARTIRALPDARFAQLIAGYVTITVAGVTIAVPPSGHLTGREALCDRENAAGPGQPCAQGFGIFETATGVTRRWSRSDMLAMKDAGITLIVQDPDGNVFAEDAITAVDPVTWPAFAEVNGMRVTMAIHNQIRQVLKARLSALIDAKGQLAAAAAKDCVGICSSWYQRGALYGETPDEAFAVTVVGDAARRTLTGTTQLRTTPSTQLVDMTIVQVAAGDTI